MTGKFSLRLCLQLRTDDHQQHSKIQHNSFIQHSCNIKRESFEYSRSLIGQIRAYKPDIPLPIVLVANKIDLERARVVKNEGKYQTKHLLQLFLIAESLMSLILS